MDPAVQVGERRHMHPGGSPRTASAGVFVGAYIDHCRGITVICVLKHDQIAPAGVRTGEAQRKLVGLAPGIHEITHLERSR